MKKLFMLLLALFFSLTLWSMPAWCADEDEESDEFVLEEITVTAQKREENQQKVAISMEVISAESMKELGATNLTEILSNVSGAIVQKAADGLRVSLRGISDDSSSFYGQSMAAPTVAINTDGVYSNRKDTGSSLFDVERVEVLYGPQSTMYSSNSPGGIVNVVTAQPKIDKFEVNGSIEAGNYSLWNYQAAVNVPLGQKFAMRLSGTKSERDGYLEGGADTEDTKSGRFRVLYQISDKMSLTATAEISKDDSIGAGGGVVVFVDESDVENPWTSSGGSDTPATNDSTSEKYSANFDWDLGFMSATLIPSYSKGDSERVRVMTFGDTVDITYSESDHWEKGAELRLVSTSDFFFKWILGATYYDSEDTQDELSADYVATGEGKFSYRTNTEENRAIFANVTVPVMEDLRLTGGIRASWDEMITQNYECTWEADENAYVLKDESPSQNTTEGRPDIKVGFEYDLAETSMIYGDYSTSYRVQGMSQVSDPQELKSFSLGAKNRFFDNKLQLNASAYYYDYSNYSVSYRNEIWIGDVNDNGVMDGATGDGPPGESNGEASEVENAAPDGVTGEGRMIGVDLSATAVITTKDIVTLSVAYIKSEWTDLYFDWTYDTEWIFDDNGDIVQIPLEDVSYEGKQMQNTPEWTINLGYTHNFALWNGGNLKVSVNSKYQSAYRLSWNDDEYPENYQEAFHMENASVAYNHPGGVWTLSAYINNINNYAEKRMYMNAGGQGQLSIGDPRTYGGVLSFKF